MTPSVRLKEIMKSDEIVEIGIDGSKRLYIKPASNRYLHIWREGVEVHWDDEQRFLYSPEPRNWTYTEWYRHIVGVAETHEDSLVLTDETKWVNVPEALQAEIQEWMTERKAT